MIRLTIIREIQSSEISFLEEMLYEAIYKPEGTKKFSFDIINQPELSRYIKNFGRLGDNCLVAEVEGKLAGAIWTRLYTDDEKGYGYVDATTPELSMAVVEHYRHKRIGRQLLNGMVQKLTEQNYAQVSLSVNKLNYAFDFYKKQGFKVVESTDKSAIMVKKLRKKT
jgi:ribosomal protein S18 acetylase RimI-like enzyme